MTVKVWHDVSKGQLMSDTVTIIVLKSPMLKFKPVTMNIIISTCKFCHNFLYPVFKT